MTKEERRLWYAFLKDYPVRFQRQKVIDNYIVDFFCHAARLVIELDGDQHGEPENIRHDALRTAELESRGLRVLRFTNQEVEQGLDAVCNLINQAVRERLPASAGFQPTITEYDD